MRTASCLLLTIFIFSAFTGVCSGDVWFEGHNPQESQEILVDMNIKAVYPSCRLILSETQPRIVNLTIIVTTWDWYYQTENFSTWLSIDSQRPEKMDLGILYSNSTGILGSLYSRQHNVTLSGLEDGSHSIEIRVEGDYYMTPYPNKLGLSGNNYVCIGTPVFFIVNNSETSLLPTTTITGDQSENQFPTVTHIAVASIVIIAVLVVSLLLYLRIARTRREHVIV